jgi:flagellar motility protein MotE (MotC chaperone)
MKALNENDIRELIQIALLEQAEDAPPADENETPEEQTTRQEIINNKRERIALIQKVIQQKKERIQNLRDNIAKVEEDIKKKTEEVNKLLSEV